MSENEESKSESSSSDEDSDDDTAPKRVSQSQRKRMFDSDSDSDSEVCSGSLKVCFRRNSSSLFPLQSQLKFNIVSMVKDTPEQGKLGYSPILFNKKIKDAAHNKILNGEK